MPPCATLQTGELARAWHGPGASACFPVAQLLWWMVSEGTTTAAGGEERCPVRWWRCTCLRSWGVGFEPHMCTFQTRLATRCVPASVGCQQVHPDRVCVCACVCQASWRALHACRVDDLTSTLEACPDRTIVHGDFKVGTAGDGGSALPLPQCLLVQP